MNNNLRVRNAVMEEMKKFPEVFGIFDESEVHVGEIYYNMYNVGLKRGCLNFPYIDSLMNSEKRKKFCNQFLEYLNKTKLKCNFNSVSFLQ